MAHRKYIHGPNVRSSWKNRLASHLYKNRGAYRGAARGALGFVRDLGITHARRTMKPKKGGSYSKRARAQSSKGRVGRYQGRFKKRRITRDIYNLKGLTSVTEVSGVVNDSDCVYVGHTCVALSAMLDTILSALLKTLLVKAGLQVDSVSMNLDSLVVTGVEAGPNTLTAYGFRFTLLCTQGDTDVITTFVYDTQIGNTIKSIVGDISTGSAGSWATLRNVFVDYCTGGDLNNVRVRKPVKLLFSVYDVGTSPVQYKMVSELNLQNLILHLRVKSELKIQNRTVADNTADTDAFDVANNPIVGWNYHFNTGSPRFKGNGPFLLEYMGSYTGVITQASADFEDSQNQYNINFKEPPIPNVFRNIEKAGKVRLDPGMIKSDHLFFERKVSLFKFLEQFGWQRTAALLDSGVTQPNSIKAMGKCALYALEDIINVSPASNLVTIAYEVNRTTSVYFSTRSNAPSHASFFQIAQNNFTVPV